MKLINFAVSGGARLGCAVGNDVLDVNGYLRRDLQRQGYDVATAARMADQAAPSDIGDVLAGGKAVLGRLQAAASNVAKASAAEQAALRAERILCGQGEISYLPPLPAEATLFCIGRNYMDHVAEAGSKTSEKPSLFTRLHNSVVGHQQPLLRPKLSHHFDWEVELAVVIGSHCRYVKKADYRKVVAGYSIFNDGSLRDYQRAAPNLTAGKNFFHSGAMGPWIITDDEVPDPQALQLRTLINGEVMQNANTKDMIFDIGTLIEYITEFTPLRPGDVISTGTPAGVGFIRKPPRFLVPGDALRMEVEKVGVLENGIVDEA